MFVHGLGGDPVSTWCSKGGQDDGHFWPRWLAEDIKGLAVYSVYRQCLDLMPRERAPLDWAMMQMKFGNALSTLGVRALPER